MKQVYDVYFFSTKNILSKHRPIIFFISTLDDSTSDLVVALLHFMVHDNTIIA